VGSFSGSIKTNGKIKTNSKVNGNGQECPFYTCRARFAPRTVEGDCPYMGTGARDWDGGRDPSTTLRDSLRESLSFAQDDTVEKATALPWPPHSRVPFYTSAGGNAKYLCGVGLRGG
jgi:hypothetical protein